MSDSKYTLKIEIDDSKIREIEKRLMNIVNGKGGLGEKATSASSGGSMMKNIAKLGTIAVGVAGLVMLVKKIAEITVSASPMFQQMLKLINFGVLLILRPLGDFFGFFLRPLIIYFLRSIVLPFYRLMRPIMQKLGTFLGMSVTQNVAGTLSGVWALITGDWEEVSRITSESNARIQAFWEGVSTDVSIWLTSLDLPSFSELTTNITTWISDQGLLLPNFGGMIFSSLATWLIFETAKLPTFEALITRWNEWTANISLPNWEDVTNIIDSITAGILGIVDSIRDFIIDLASKFGVDLGWNDSRTQSPITIIPQEYFSDESNSSMVDWSETPEGRFSDSGKGGGH